MNWFNLGAIIILIYTAKTGFKDGLVTGVVNVFIVFWATLAAFTFLVPLSHMLQKFLVQSQWQARIIGLWLPFLGMAIVLWETFGKKLQKEKIVLFKHLDHLGGLISGLLFGLGLFSFLVLTVYMVPPGGGKDKQNFAFLKKPLIFHMDELLPRFYGLMVKKELAEGEGKTIYRFEEFMYKYNYIKGKKYKSEVGARTESEKKKNRDTR